MPRRRSTEPALVLLVATVLAIAMTYPMALRLGRMARIDSGDGQFSIWIVSWVARTLVADPAHLYDANIFYPHQGALAYSETFFVPGVLAIPGYWATRDPYVAHNSSLILGLVLTWIATYYLVRYVTANRLAAGVSAILFTFCPFVFARTAHIHLASTVGLPLTLLTLHRLVDRPGLLRALALGGALAVAALSAGYYGIFAALTCAVGGAFYLVSRRYWRRWDYYAWLAAAAGVSVAIVGPFFLPYLGLKQQVGPLRSLRDAAAYSATWRAYLAGPGYGDRWMLPLVKTWNEVLFPGFVTIALAAAGIWAGWQAGRRRGVAADARRAVRADPSGVAEGSSAGSATAQRRGETVLFYLTIALVAAWFSFGPSAGLYTVLYHAMPALSFIRAPVRMAIVFTLALTVLAGIGFTRLATGRRAPLVAVLVGLVALAELAVAPLRFRETPPFSPVYRVLASLPRGGVVEFPFFHHREFPRHCRYMLNSTVHWQPLVNGYSDYIPLDVAAAAEAIHSFPSQAAFPLLRERQARYVVFHTNAYDSPSLSLLRDRLKRYAADLRPLANDGEVELYEIVNWPS